MMLMTTDNVVNILTMVFFVFLSIANIYIIVFLRSAESNDERGQEIYRKTFWPFSTVVTCGWAIITLIDNFFDMGIVLYKLGMLLLLAVGTCWQAALLRKLRKIH
jgi:hypothetical protein